MVDRESYDGLFGEMQVDTSNNKKITDIAMAAVAKYETYLFDVVEQG